MDFRATDFKSLMFNVYDLPEETNIIKRFPILNKIKIFKKDLGALIPINWVLTYIFITFDRRSPLHSITDLMERRHNGALLAHFTYQKDGKFNTEVEAMLYGKNPDVNKMIIRFCVLQGEDDYTAMIGYQEAIRRETQKLLDDKEVLSTVITNINKLRNEIETIRAKLLTTNEDALLKKDLYNFSEAEGLGLSPEAYAKMLIKVEK